MKPDRKPRRQGGGRPPATGVGVEDPPPAAPHHSIPWWVVAAALAVAFVAYLPALNGPFVFDDLTLPVLQEQDATPLEAYFRGVRPLYYLSLKAQHLLAGHSPAPFHVVNWLLHALNALLLFAILKRYAALAQLLPGPALAASAFGAGLFLLHPLNTEAVSYIASHSEVLSVFFGFLAWLVFIRNHHPRLGLRAALSVALLLTLALASKEHVIALIGVFLLTDLLYGSLRANLRFYVPLAAFGAAAAALLLSRITNVTAGFNVEGASPLSYLVTQGTVIWRYLLLSVAPLGQSVDHGVPISVTPLGLAGLATLAGVTLYLWKKAPRLALLGWLTFLLLLAPTSSFVPIADAMVERRMYLAMPGLALLVAPWIHRVNRHALAGVLLVLALLTWNRNEQWSSSESLWRDAVAGNPANSRAQFQLAHALYLDGRCAEALPHFAAADQHGGGEDALYIDWALAHDCTGQPDQGLAILQRAADDSHLRWATQGMIEGKRGRSAEALAALDRATALRPDFAMSWVYQGNVFTALGRHDQAEASYRRALALEPSNPAALQGLRALSAR